MTRQVERMGAFFDVRANGYDEHMQQNVDGFGPFYEAIAAALPRSQEPRDVLDLGIGTGLQLPGLFACLPHARVTGIDLSLEMMAELRAKHAARLDQIRLVHGSFLTVDFGHAAYDVVISAMALHHHPFDEKADLFSRIRRALKPGGCFINGDYIVSPDEAAKMLAAYEAAIPGLDPNEGPVHIDIPFSMDDELAVLRRAGFDSIEVPYYRAAAAVFVAGVHGSSGG